MKRPNFTHLDPEDLHSCQHCRHLSLDMVTGYFCDIDRTRDFFKRKQEVFMVNDCENYVSHFVSDYRRRPDLEAQLKKAKK